jgi:hypothetical protein
MRHNRQRWRFRISTMMLFIIIAALLFERWHRESEAMRTEARLRDMLKQAEAAALDLTVVNSAWAPAQQGTPDTAPETGTGVR